MRRAGRLAEFYLLIERHHSHHEKNTDAIGKGSIIIYSKMELFAHTLTLFVSLMNSQ